MSDYNYYFKAVQNELANLRFREKLPLYTGIDK